MNLSDSTRLRQECWDSIGPAVRDRLLQRSGELIEWYAAEDTTSGDGRSTAVVFGDQALCIAEPRVNAEHRPVYAINSYILDPGSFRRASIDHRPQAGPAGAQVGAPSGVPSAVPQTAGPVPAGAQGADLGINASARGIIGNLPARAQELLQAPFSPERRVLRHGWHYEGSPHRLTMFMIYLAGARHVTVAAGTKVVPVGHAPSAAHWALTCYRASVTRRAGS